MELGLEFPANKLCLRKVCDPFSDSVNIHVVKLQRFSPTYYWKVYVGNVRFSGIRDKC